MTDASKKVGGTKKIVIDIVLFALVVVLFVIFMIPWLGYLGVIICEPVIWCLMCLQLYFSSTAIRISGSLRDREKQSG